MEVKASLKYLRISPRKTRLVTNLIKGLPVKDAEAQLTYISKKSGQPVLKLLKSAIANAENNFHLDKDNLYIKIIRVDEGPALKRWRARARGSAYTIKKRTSHIFLVLDEIKKKSQPILKSKVKTEEKTEKEIKKEEKKELESKRPPLAKEELGKRTTKKIAPKRVILKKKVFPRKAI
ncbi:MAG: 50S ribosomal protein L22 [Candidatus Paceibacterota bacterium]|jgi:large subunit ribosomal protein L22